MATIGEQIRSARRAKGMTQSELADAMNITRTGISKWETDDRIPDAETLLRLSEVLGYQFTLNSAEGNSGENGENSDILKESEEPEEPAESEAAEPPARETAPEEQAPQPAEKAPSASGILRSPRFLRICAALAVVILAVVLIIVNQPKSSQPATAEPDVTAAPEVTATKAAVVYTDSSGKEFTAEEFDAPVSRDPEKAFLEFRNSMRFSGEQRDKRIFFDFNMYEENGIALHIDRIDMVLLYTNGSASVDSFTAKDISDWGDSPDLRPNGSYTFTGGTDYYTSKGEVDAAGAGLKVYCTDAGDNQLVFTSFIAFPAQ